MFLLVVHCIMTQGEKLFYGQKYIHESAINVHPRKTVDLAPKFETF